ncbi:uncharacterized mitochondrial protein-like protein [Tanacetum coccineum]
MTVRVLGLCHKHQDCFGFEVLKQIKVVGLKENARKGWFVSPDSVRLVVATTTKGAFGLSEKAHRVLGVGPVLRNTQGVCCAAALRKAFGIAEIAQVADSSIALTAYGDADHVGCQDTRRSTSGCMQLLGDRLVSWSSKRQKSTAISSTEAEYIALSGYCA